MQWPQTIRDHPYVWGIGAAVVVVLVFFVFGGSSKSQTTGNATDWLSAYYAAQANAAASGNSLAATDTAAQASTNQAEITAQTAVATGQQQADVANNYINALAQIGTAQTNAALILGQTQANNALASSLFESASGNPQPGDTSNTGQQLAGIVAERITQLNLGAGINQQPPAGNANDNSLVLPVRTNATTAAG